MPSLTALTAFWLAVAACAVAQAAIVRAVVTGGTAPGRGTPPTDAGEATDREATPMGGREGPIGRELVWACAPGLVLVLVFLWTWHVMHTAASLTGPA